MDPFLKKMVNIDVNRKISIANTRVIEFLVRNETGKINILCLSGDPERIKIILCLLSGNNPAGIGNYEICIYNIGDDSKRFVCECTGIDKDIRVVTLSHEDMMRKILEDGDTILDSSYYDNNSIAESIWKINGCSSPIDSALWIIPFYSFNDNDFSALHKKTVNIGKRLVEKK